MEKHMNKELKEYLKEFEKITDQIVELKKVGIISEQVIELHGLILDKIKGSIESEEAYLQEVSEPKLGDIFNGRET